MVADNRQSDFKAFQERLRDVAKQRGGLKPLAKASGLPYSTLQKYLAKNNPKEPSRKNLVQIISATDVSSDWLLTGRGKMDAKEIIQLPRLEGTENAFCVPLFSEEIFRTAINENFDVSDHSTILRKIYTDMLSKAYRVLTKEEVYELLGKYANSAVALSARDVSCGNDYSNVQTIYIQFEEVFPGTGDLIVIDDIDGHLRLVKALVREGIIRYERLDGKKLEDPNSLNPMIRPEKILGRLLAVTSSARY